MYRSTTHMRGGLPHQLREMSPVLEVGHARVCFAVETVVPGFLMIVELICDDCWYTLRRCASGDVLTVAAAGDVHAVGEGAGEGDRMGDLGEVVVPGYCGSGMVAAMEVVLVYDHAGVAIAITWRRSLEVRGWL